MKKKKKENKLTSEQSKYLEFYLRAMSKVIFIYDITPVNYAKAE